MTMPTSPDLAALARLLALVGEALALSDALALHATGIALDTARLSVEDAMAEARYAGHANPSPDGVVAGCGRGLG